MSDTQAGRLEVFAISGLPVLSEGCQLGEEIARAIDTGSTSLQRNDVLVVASTIVARTEGRKVDISSIVPSEEAIRLARVVDKDPAYVEVVLRESACVSRAKSGVLIARHRRGYVAANAGIDRSNVGHEQEGTPLGSWVLCLPSDPDASAASLRMQLETHCGFELGVIISDSIGRPFRRGTVGIALGVSGMCPLRDQRGQLDLFGRRLETSWSADADAIAAAADLVMGQSDQGCAVVVVRGFLSRGSLGTGRDLIRSVEEDLYL